MTESPVEHTHRPSRKVLAIVMAACAAVILATFGWLLFGNDGKPPAPAPVAASAPAETPSELPSDNPVVCTDDSDPLTVKADATQVEHDEGAYFLGTACLKPGEQILAFDYDEGDQKYFLDTDDNNTAALVTESGTWTWIDRPIGNEGDGVPSEGLTQGDPQKVHFVLADGKCQQWVSSLEPNGDGDITTDNIKQHGCVVVHVETVYVTDMD